MDFAAVLPFAAFGAIACGVWAVLNSLSTQTNRAASRLAELRNPLARRPDAAGRKGPASSSAVGQMLEKAAPSLSKALEPKTELEQSQLRVRLGNAGFHSPAAVQLFLAIKIISMGCGVVIGSGVGLGFFGLSQSAMTSFIIGGGFGFYLPELVLSYLISSRQKAIFLSLPDALDLLVVCVEAGLGLDAAMRRVSEELADVAPELTGELNLCNFQLQMGRPRREMLHDLGVRTGVDDVRALVAILIQADRFGSSIAQALRVQSDSMRVKRRQMAEEKAQQTAVKMIFPLVLFIFPGIFVVLVGPAAISMIRNLLTS
jgi:tight adherence protein C